jgi:hypothetical protein
MREFWRNFCRDRAMMSGESAMPFSQVMIVASAAADRPPQPVSH